MIITKSCGTLETFVDQHPITPNWNKTFRDRHFPAFRRRMMKNSKNVAICFSKLETMHDTVIELLINKVEFGLDIHA
jgi:hypothetical protein